MSKSKVHCRIIHDNQDVRAKVLFKKWRNYAPWDRIKPQKGLLPVVMTATNPTNWQYELILIRSDSVPFT